MSFNIKKYIVCFVVALIGCYLIDDAKTMFGVLMLIWSVDIEKIKESDCE